jgi:uncharacterized protein (TIGR01777 family)
MRVAITGATGTLGTALSEHLRAQGHAVTPISRRPQAAPSGGIVWDPLRGQIDAAALEGHDVVVNLAGARIAPASWTRRYKQLIRDSRVLSTRLLSETLARLSRPPRVLLSQSAIGYYGARSAEEILDEDSSCGAGFLAGVVVEWEAATEPAQRAGIRTVLVRTGPVLARRGGFLAPLLPVFRMGLGGRLGSGRQTLSWVAVDDYVGAAMRIIDDNSLIGPVNVTAPTPVSNAEFTRSLARVLRRPAIFCVPAFALRVAFGSQMAEEVLLGGQRVLPRKLLGLGFGFRYAELEGALRAILT